MSRTRVLSLISLIFVVFSFSVVGVFSATFTLTNNCGHAVWPGILSGASTAPLSTTGFAMEPGESRTVDPPAAWSGRLWGRTLCSTDSAGKFMCGTGDCGSGAIECSGGGAAPPATLAEFTLDGSGGMDFYDVSLVDGYNLPMLVVAEGGRCGVTGCLVDLNGACPADLKVSSSEEGGGSGAVACRSACEAFRLEEYCCSGAYGSPGACRPTAYSAFFKNACPRAYSYAYDDATSTFTCPAGANYVITFCPRTTSLKSVDVTTGATGGLPLINETMLALSGAPPRVTVCVLPVLAVLFVSWRLLQLR